MKKITTLLMTAAFVFSMPGCVNAASNENTPSTAESSISSTESAGDKSIAKGESLVDWAAEEGWTAFYTFTRDEKLNEAWDAAAEAFGPTIGMDDLDGDGLKALNVQICGLEDDIVRLEFAEDKISAMDSTGNTVFSHKYSYITTIDNAIEEGTVYVYKTDDSDADKYTCLCLTLPTVESDEGGIMTYFRLRYAAENYEDLFSEDYNGVTGVMVDASTSEEDLDYTIRLLYGAEVNQ